MILRVLIPALLIGAALSGCVSQEQIAINKERAARSEQGAVFNLTGCEYVDGKNSCFETAKARCSTLGQQYVWMTATHGQVRAGKGEMTVKCIPPAKET